MNGRSWIALFALAVQSVSTAALWFRSRHLPLLRPWLVRHVIGNFVLAIGLIAAWSFNLALFYYVLIAVSVYAMWIWGTWKLREASTAQRRESGE